MAYLWHMRTTIELPDELLVLAKREAGTKGVSLRQFFIEAVTYRLAPEKRKVRKAPPAIGNAGEPAMSSLTREQIDEAMFG